MSHSSVAIEDIAGLSERTLFERTIASQAFWVTVADTRTASAFVSRTMRARSATGTCAPRLRASMPW